MLSNKISSVTGQNIIQFSGKLNVCKFWIEKTPILEIFEPSRLITLIPTYLNLTLMFSISSPCVTL